MWVKIQRPRTMDWRTTVILSFALEMMLVVFSGSLEGMGMPILEIEDVSRHVQIMCYYYIQVVPDRVLQVDDRAFLDMVDKLIDSITDPITNIYKWRTLKVEVESLASRTRTTATLLLPPRPCIKLISVGHNIIMVILNILTVFGVLLAFVEAFWMPYFQDTHAGHERQHPSLSMMIKVSYYICF